MMKEVDVAVKTHKEGKSIEEIKKPTMFAKVKGYVVMGLILVFVLRSAVPKEFWQMGREFIGY